MGPATGTSGGARARVGEAACPPLSSPAPPAASAAPPPSACAPTATTSSAFDLREDGRTVRRRPHDPRGQRERRRRRARRASAGSTSSSPTPASSTSRRSRDFPEDRWDAILAILLTSPFLLAKYAWDALAASGSGRFIAVASAHALVASPYKAAYVSAKHGVLGLVKTLALEGAEAGITATAVCPGYVRTPLVEGQLPDQAQGARHQRGARCSRRSSWRRTRSSG